MDADLNEQIRTAVAAEDGAAIGAIVDGLRFRGRLTHAGCVARFQEAVPALSASEVDGLFALADETAAGEG